MDVKKEDFGGIEIPIAMGLATKTSIYRLTSEGKIPHYKINGKLKFLEEELQEWIKKHKVPLRYQH